MSDKFVPESVLKRLVVGQHVRYVPPDMCDYLPSLESHGGALGAVNHESITNAEHKTGAIENIRMNPRIPDHPYRVHMDEKYTFGGRIYCCITVAAHELALVED